MDDTPEPFTQEATFRLLDFARAIALVALVAVIVLAGAPFVSWLIR